MLISLNNGEIIMGNFIDGIINGNGKQYFPNGDIYEGNFLNGKFNGLGIYIYNNKDKYIGNFLNGDFNGEGELTFNNGDKYVGNFINGSRSGKGVFYFGKGGVYEGNFLDDSFHGEGILYQENGDIFGNFQDKRKIVILRLTRNENDVNKRKILRFLWEMTLILNQKPFILSKTPEANFYRIREESPLSTINILLCGFTRKGKSTFS